MNVNELVMRLQIEDHWKYLTEDANEDTLFALTRYIEEISKLHRPIGNVTVRAILLSGMYLIRYSKSVSVPNIRELCEIYCTHEDKLSGVLELLAIMTRVEMEESEPSYGAVVWVSKALAKLEQECLDRYIVEPEVTVLDERPKPDAGTLSRERLIKRTAAIKVAARRFWNMIAGLTVLVVLVLAGALTYTLKTLPATYVVDSRPCIIQNASKTLTISGQRSYAYFSSELFGIRFHRAADMTERTDIDVRGVGMLIVGQDPDAYWVKRVKDGVQGSKSLKRAATYTFVIGDDAIVVDYKKMCR